MSTKLEKLKKEITARLDEAEKSVGKAKRHAGYKSDKAKLEVEQRLNEMQTGLATHKQELSEARARLSGKIEDKKEDVQKWKANREQEKLERRAEKAEEMAIDQALVALREIDGAEFAFLVAIAARLDADGELQQ